MCTETKTEILVLNNVPQVRFVLKPREEYNGRGWSLEKA